MKILASQENKLCVICKINVIAHRSKKFCSYACMGISERTTYSRRRNVFPACKDCKKPLHSIIAIRCMACRGIYFSRDRSAGWQGGKTILQKIIRTSSRYIAWRKSIFERDEYTCQECKSKGVRIEANHIIPFSFILRFYKIENFQEALNCNDLWKLNNGETLCKKCHQELRPNRPKYYNVLKLQKTI